jgi:thiol:disulfide interchange protein DsbC
MFHIDTIHGTFRTITIAIASLLTVGVMCVAYGADSTGVAKAKENLARLYPSTKFSSVEQTVYPGMYEVVMGKTVVYTDEAARYFLFGHLFDMQEQKDLTQDRISEVTKVDFSKLPTEAAIVFKQGKGTRKFAVFSDPECPYCRRLEPELAKLTDVTIYLYMLPLPIHPDAKGKAEAIWCSKDKAESWREMMLQNREVKSKACDTPIGTIAGLARDFNITATPTLVSSDGRVRPGASPAEAIDAWLNGGAK